jgi:hypothetical protein
MELGSEGEGPIYWMESMLPIHISTPLDMQSYPFSLAHTKHPHISFPLPLCHPHALYAKPGGKLKQKKESITIE